MSVVLVAHANVQDLVLSSNTYWHVSQYKVTSIKVNQITPHSYVCACVCHTAIHTPIPSSPGQNRSLFLVPSSNTYWHISHYRMVWISVNQITSSFVWSYSCMCMCVLLPSLPLPPLLPARIVPLFLP